jgi:hypothetical protein
MRLTFAKADIPQSLRLYDFYFGRFGKLGLAMNDARGSASRVVKRHRSRPDRRGTRCVIVRLQFYSSLPPLRCCHAWDSLKIFRQAIDTRNTGDIVAMMALFTDDAVREDGSSQPPCVGFAAVRASFQKDPAFGRFAGCPAPSQVAPGRSDHARS